MASVKFYFDEMMPREPMRQLNERGYDTIMAVDVGMMHKSDPQHLQYATSQQRVMVTFDQPFAGKTMKQSGHAGLICITSVQTDDIGEIVRLLDDFAQLYEGEDTAGQVFWL